MKTPEILLTQEQGKELTQIPETIPDWEIAKYYTLSEQDIEITNQNRRDYNKLGFACHYRYMLMGSFSYRFYTEVSYFICVTTIRC